MAGPDDHLSALPVSFADFRLLVLLFLGLRLTFAVVYHPALVTVGAEPEAAVPVERGLSAFGDLPYYYRLVTLADRGMLPYRDYRFEFPPVVWGLYAGLYEIAGLGKGAPYADWALLTGLTMTVCDVGILYLLRRLGERLYGSPTGIALAWVYALLAGPAIVSWWTFEPLVALTMLLALWWSLNDRLWGAALVTVFGVLTKYIPVLILFTVWRFWSARRAWRFTALIALILILVAGLLWGWGGRMAYASLMAQFHKPSYQTIWALLDGNWRTGLFVAPEQRTDANSALEQGGEAAAVPVIVRLAFLVVTGGYLWLQTRCRNERAVVAFFTATVVLFYLWAQGWSPQWLVVLLPLILLNFPQRLGVMVCVVLTLGAFIEYPVLFMRTADTGGTIGSALRPAFALLILARTGILVGVTVALGRRLRDETA